MSLKRKYLFFAFIVLINIILKALYSGNSPFSYDEIISLKNTLLDFGHIKHEAEWDNNPPFYYYSLWVWHQVMPRTEFFARLLSVIFVSVSIGLSFLFALKYFNVQTAFYSAALLSTSNFLIFYSQETRTYSLIVLLALISSIQFFKYSEKPSVSNLLILSLINFLLIYSHYIAGIILIVQYITVFFQKEKKKQFYTVQTIFIAVLVYLRFTKKQFYNIIGFNKKEDFWLKRAKFNDLVNAVSELFFNYWIALVFILAAFVFIYYYAKNAKTDFLKVKLYTFILGFVSVLFLFFLGTFKAIFLPRYLIFSIPFAVIIVVYQFIQFGKSGTLAVTVLFLISLYFCRLTKDSGADFRVIANIIKENKKDKDVVIINTRDNLLLFQYYYNREDFFKYKNLDSVSKTHNIYGINEVAQLNDIEFNSGSEVFLIQSFHKINSSTNPMISALEKGFLKIYSKELKGSTELSVFKNTSL